MFGLQIYCFITGNPRTLKFSVRYNAYNGFFSESEEFDAKYRSNIQFTYNGEALWVPPSLQKSACEGNVRSLNHWNIRVNNNASI